VPAGDSADKLLRAVADWRCCRRLVVRRTGADVVDVDEKSCRRQPPPQPLLLALVVLVLAVSLPDVDAAVAVVLLRELLQAFWNMGNRRPFLLKELLILPLLGVVVA